MPKKRKGLPRDEPAGSQDEVELTGAVVDGELYLRDPDGNKISCFFYHYDAAEDAGA